MSRHELTAPGIEAIVGWDPPLNTFFAQVWDTTREEDDPSAELLWIGCSPAEIRDPRQVCNAVAAWVKVPPGLAEKLAADAQAVAR